MPTGRGDRVLRRRPEDPHQPDIHCHACRLTMTDDGTTVRCSHCDSPCGRANCPLCRQVAEYSGSGPKAPHA